MMPKNIKRQKAKHKQEAIWSVLLFALVQLACAACFGALCLIPEAPKWLTVLFGSIAVFCLALILPAMIVLKQRFHEIEGGEINAASQY